MSLMSLLNQDYSTASSTTSSTSAQVAQAMQVLTKAQEKAGEATTSGTKQASISITVEARRAAATKADAAKSPAALAKELRASLDEQDGKSSAKFTTMSGRALATIALNETGQFSKSEIAAAKLELRSRDRQSALTMLASGPLTSASLATYTRNLLAARDLMSAEEQRLRATDPNLR